MITLQQVSKIYQPKGHLPVTAVRDVTLEIGQNEFVVITGRSGSGKTTLLNLAAGLSRPSAGRVLLDGVNLWSLTDAQQAAFRSQRMGFVFQFPSLLPALTVLENVAMPALFAKQAAAKGNAGAKTVATNTPFAGAKAVIERAELLLAQVGLESKRPAYPRHLSAGQQQRVVIARALLNQPRLLLADEPTSNLDEQTEQEIMALFQEIHTSTDITIVMVTHAGPLVPCGTRAIHMTNGVIDQDERAQEPLA